DSLFLLSLCDLCAFAVCFLLLPSKRVLLVLVLFLGLDHVPVSVGLFLGRVDGLVALGVAGFRFLNLRGIALIIGGGLFLIHRLAAVGVLVLFGLLALFFITADDHRHGEKAGAQRQGAEILSHGLVPLCLA